MLAVVIPTYDNLIMLCRLVDQLYERTKDFRLYIVEDGQKPETISYLESLSKEKQNLTVLLHETNKGVAASWNDGIREALSDRCESFVILNDDIEVPEGWQEVVEKALDTHGFVSLELDFTTFIFSGFFFALTERTIREVGYFDERFIFYYEDVDYSLRLQASKVKHAKVRLGVIHHESATIEGNIKQKDPKRYAKIVQDGLSLVLSKHKNLRNVEKKL